MSIVPIKHIKIRHLLAGFTAKKQDRATAHENDNRDEGRDKNVAGDGYGDDNEDKDERDKMIVDKALDEVGNA